MHRWYYTSPVGNLKAPLTVQKGEKAGEHWAIALSPEGRYLAVTTHEGKIYVYDTTNIRSDSKGIDTVARFETKGSFGMSIDIVRLHSSHYLLCTLLTHDIRSHPMAK